MHIGQPPVQPAVAHRQPLMVNAHQALVRRVGRQLPRWLAGDQRLSQIDTGPSTPVPTAQEIDQATPLGGGAAGITHLAGGGAHASLLLLMWKIVGVDTDFVHETVVVLAGQTVSGLPVGATVEFKDRASNSKGHTDSAVKSVVVT